MIMSQLHGWIKHFDLPLDGLAVDHRAQLDAGQKGARQLAVQGVGLVRGRRQAILEHGAPEPSDAQYRRTSRISSTVKRTPSFSASSSTLQWQHEFVGDLGKEALGWERMGCSNGAKEYAYISTQPPRSVLRSTKRSITEPFPPPFLLPATSFVSPPSH